LNHLDGEGLGPLEYPIGTDMVDIVTHLES
jgi:hypothetical protein